jgi:hypothetical protein
MKEKSTRSVVFAVTVIAILAGGAAVTFIAQRRSSKAASVTAAAIEFDQLRARFSGDQALVDMVQRRSSIEIPAGSATPPVHVIHTVVFDTRDDTEFDPEPIDLPLEQIARHGPGLLVDFHHPSGGQFFSWAD